jgi:hypothetical protein
MNKESVIKYASLALLVLITLQTCGTKGKMKSMQKDIDSLTVMVKNSPTKNDLIIEGLKNEKRMIQATDRKLLDVKRQSEIDAELSSLQK